MLLRSRTFSAHALISIFLALPSESAPAQKPAMTKSIDEPGRTPYTSGVAKACDTNCFAQFKVVPAGYRLVVTYIQVAFPVLQSGPSYVTLSGGPVFLYLPQVAPIDRGTSRFYILSTPLSYYVEAGLSPEISISNASGVNGALIGYLVAID